MKPIFLKYVFWIVIGVLWAWNMRNAPLWLGLPMSALFGGLVMWAIWPLRTRRKWWVMFEPHPDMGTPWGDGRMLKLAECEGTLDEAAKLGDDIVCQVAHRTQTVVHGRLRVIEERAAKRELTSHMVELGGKPN